MPEPGCSSLAALNLEVQQNLLATHACAPHTLFTAYMQDTVLCRNGHQLQLNCLPKALVLSQLGVVSKIQLSVVLVDAANAGSTPEFVAGELA